MNRPEGTSWQTHHGVEYGMWDSPDKIGRHFTEGKLYEQPLLEWIYAQPFTPDSVALDVGANIGNHTLWMGSVCGLLVHAFEPVMPHVVRANWHLNVHSIPDTVTIHHCGLGDRPGTYHHTSRGVLRPGISQESTDEVVQIRTMDSFEFVNVALVKVDVEGMELAVLRGGYNTIRRWKPALLVEEWDASTTAAVREFLTPFGYERMQQFGGGKRKTAPMGVWQA